MKKRSERRTTLRRSSKSMKEKPRTVSHKLISIQLAKMPGKTLAKEEPGNLRPKSVLNCATMTVTAAAEQKPEMTGPEIKSIIHPAGVNIFI